jgi:hypothetical protein
LDSDEPSNPSEAETTHRADDKATDMSRYLGHRKSQDAFIGPSVETRRNRVNKPQKAS